jgi:hypothetical protein
MARFKRYLGLAVATGFVLMLFSPVFPNVFSPKIVSIALAKRKLSKKTDQKSKKKIVEKNSTIVFPVKIVGEAGCLQSTNLALSILQKKSLGDFEKTAQNIGVVECTKAGSGVFVQENPARFKVGLATYQADSFWYASVLLHESCHIEEYRNYLSSHPGERVPPEIFSGAEAESECLLAQYNCLDRLGAGESLLDYTKKIAQTSYWNIPIEKRWW